MTAGDVTDEEIQDFKRLFPASRRLATALEASRAEASALRRQLEELREIELSEECRGLLMANGSDWTILVCGEFANGREFSQKFRARPTPPPDVVTVPREEWTIAQILANAWGRHPMTCGERDKLVAEWDTLRSGEAERGKS